MRLDSLSQVAAEQWLSQNQVYIMAGLFLVLGVMAILKGWARLPA